MAHIDEQGRPEPPLAADEVTSLTGYLDYQRATLEWKCRGLDQAALGATIPSSAMTLGGLLKHMAMVEDSWFSRGLHGNEFSSPWDSVDWDTDANWEWESAADDTPEQLFELWNNATAASRALVGDALENGGLEQLSKRTFDDGSAPSLRWIMLHMIEEYARHNGHADILREAVDGETGE